MTKSYLASNLIVDTLLIVLIVNTSDIFDKNKRYNDLWLCLSAEGRVWALH